MRSRGNLIAIYVYRCDRSCCGLPAWLQVIITSVQAIKSPLALLGQDGVARGRGGGGKESRSPFVVPGFSFGGLFPLALLNLLLLYGGFRELLGEDGLGHS